MIGRSNARAARLGLVCAMAALLVTTSAAGSSGATSGRTTIAAGRGDVLDITSVTPWVRADGEFQVRFGPTAQIPAGSILTYTIHQALDAGTAIELRDGVNAVIDGASAGKVLQTPVPRPISDYGDPLAGPVLTIPIRASSGVAGRALLPNPGIHPVELVLTPPEGPELWSQVVFLNRLPAGYEPTPADPDTTDTTTRIAGAPPVRVTMIVPVQTRPTLAADGTASFSIEERAALERAGSLLRAVPGAPLTLGLRPNTLDGLSRIDQRWADELLTSVTGAARGASGVVSMPYVAIDTGGLAAAGAGTELGRQVELGNQVIDETIGATASGSTWILDDSLTTESLGLLGARGVDTVVVPGSSLTLPSNVEDQEEMTGAVQLEGGDGIRAIAYDEMLSQRLGDAEVEPGVRANEAVSLMMAAWFGSTDPSGSDRAPASVILVPPTIDPEMIAALDPSLDGSGPLVADTEQSVLPAVSEDEPTAELSRTDAPDERGAVESAAESRRQIEGYRSMAGVADQVVPLWERLNAESLASDLDTLQRRTLHDMIRLQIAGDIARIDPPRARRVLVTSREPTIPLRFRNDLPYEVRLILEARSPRLEIEGGDSREIVLAPGENRLELPVVVQAPGESLLRIELLSPDRQLQIASLDVPVRSTAISGAGAALSVISLLFLVLWWIHTLRRRRRDGARTAGTHPCSSPPDCTPPDSRPPQAVGVDSAPEPPHTDSVAGGG